MQGQAAPSRLAWYRELYDRVAWSYDFEDSAYPFYLNEQTATLRLLDHYVPAVGASEERWALDLGCGPGQYSVWLLERGYHVMGVDISPNMIQAARRTTRAYGERAVFREGDLMTLSVPREHFSVAIAFGSLVNHLEDWAAFFRRVSLLLTRDGLLLFDVDNIFGLHQVLYAAYTGVLRMPSRPTLSGLLRRLGASLRGATYQTVLPIETHVGLLDLPLTYGSLSLMRRVTAAADLPIVAKLGTNTLAALLPSTTLSVSYRTRADGAHASLLERLLSNLDEALAFRLVGLAGLQFLVCRKRPDVGSTSCATNGLASARAAATHSQMPRVRRG
jgi:SAM-dependent methyltransferase